MAVEFTGFCSGCGRSGDHVETCKFSSARRMAAVARELVEHYQGCRGLLHGDKTKHCRVVEYLVERLSGELELWQ